MNESNMENLNRLAKLFGTDRLISPEEIQQIFKGIVEILATYKKDTSSINEDTKKVVNKLLEDVISIHKESVDAVEEKKKALDEGFTDKLTELRKYIDSVKEEISKEEEMTEDESDDEAEKQALIEEIMAQITLPEVKATIVSGEEIVDKINELPLDEDNKIDWARIKNAPKIGKQTISGSPTVLANAVDLDGSTRQDAYAIVWDAARGRYTHAAASGGTPGGSTTQLQYNNAGSFGGISGATTNGTATTFTTGNLIAHDVKASQSAGMDILSSSGTVTALFGAGGGANSTFYGGVKGDYLTASEMVISDASKNIVSAPVATYPSLTELTYVKGVTSAIQTQINGKEPTITGAGANTVWHGNKVFSAVVEADITLSDNTTNDVSTLKHGFMSKLPGTTTTFYRGDGTFATPAATTVPNAYVIQAFTNTTYNLVHNLGAYPVVQILDSTGAVVIPLSIVNNTANDLTVTFTTTGTYTIIATLGSPQLQSYVSTAIDYTALVTDRIIAVTGASKTITLPTANVTNVGYEYKIDNSSSGAIFVVGQGGETIQGEVTQTLPPNSCMSVYANGTAWRIN